MLQIRNIFKYFNSQLVLENVSFDVKKGKIFGIIGPNGAGKTTTLRIILNILTPSSGKILFNETEINHNFFNITGYLPEERGLYPKSSVINTLTYLAQLKGLKFSDALEKANFWLERLNLHDFSKYKIEELSKGNQQKVQFISAILHDPKILILDEPFSGFDPVNQTIFRDIVEEFKQDRYLILSTHLMDLAESLCDDIFLINNGKEIISGDLQKILGTNNKNVCKIAFIENIEKLDLTFFNRYKIISMKDNLLIVDFGDENIHNLLKEISTKFNLVEFKKHSTSLHDLFINLIENEK